ncbi:hypothetical protein ES705_11132 [subsurface metagenome]
MGFYKLCEKCQLKYCGWGTDKFCQKCGEKLKEITKEEFYSEEKVIISEG